jgi:hypothetical protein
MDAKQSFCWKIHRGFFPFKTILSSDVKFHFTFTIIIDINKNATTAKSIGQIYSELNQKMTRLM